MPRGRSGRPWRRLVAHVRARRGPCCRCGQPINYRLPYLNAGTGRPDPAAFSVDHYPHPLSTHPWLAEDPDNLAPAHLRCNQSAGTNTSTTEPSLGATSRDW